MFILAEFDPGDIFDWFLPRYEEVLVQLVATVIIIVILTYFLWKPIRQLLQKRRDYIAKNISDIDVQKDELSKEKNAIKQQKLQASSEYFDTVEKAKIKALEEQDKIIKNAQTEAAKLIDNAEKIIAQERINSEEEVKKQIVDIAFKAAEKILEREVNKADNAKIVDDFIKKELK